ncbi:MAG: hypothetical protein OXG30_16020, partial [bacterium]|nr:hypothetical protein [bacterium]
PPHAADHTAAQEPSSRRIQMVSTATGVASLLLLSHTLGLGVSVGVAFPAAVALIVLGVWGWRSPRRR